VTREEKILQYIDKSGCGIEIGPSHRPVAPKKQGFNVHIIDHMDRDGLVKKYQAHGVNVDAIEEVDFVWQGEEYSQLTGKSKYYDWIIASHVIEHTPDLITFLNNCDAVLKDGGVVSLVIPDKIFCFDHHRPITGISKIIDSYYQKNRLHSPGTVAEYFLNVVNKSGCIAWDAGFEGEYNFIHSVEDAIQGMDSVLNEKTYVDVHAWCFVPHSFRLLIHDIFNLGFISFKEVGFFPTEGHEFYVTLGRGGKGSDLSRMDMLAMIEAELGVNQHHVASPPFPSADTGIVQRLCRLCRSFW